MRECRFKLYLSPASEGTTEAAPTEAAARAAPKEVAIGLNMRSPQAY